ncbi:MAG: beta-phosphoglucomutase family hydrolase [Candidatus Aenigmarchaeota archaeon]|nr:beta-phosphoglucomutase family hydrolase [Candidatus Aenigmarchaeota archaeon]
MKAFIFDKDGVLAENFDAHLKAYVKLFSEMGIKITKKNLLKMYGMKTHEIVKMIMKDNRKEITEEMAKKMAEKKENYYRELVEGKLKLLPGVREFLTYLKEKGYKIGVASSASLESIRQLLRETKIDNFFDATVSGFDIKLSKPNPDIFLECTKKLNVKPEDCVVVEDSVHGIEAAKRAGMKSLAVATGQTLKKDLESLNPNWILDSLEDFRKIGEI